MVKEGSKGLPDNVSELQEMVLKLQREKSEIAEDHEKEVHLLHEKLRILQMKLFARISERFRDETAKIQKSLFPEEPETEPEGEPKQETAVVKEYRRKKPGRKPIPEDLPRVEVVHDIPEEEKQCGCGCIKERIGEETCEKIQIDPAKIWVDRHIRPKYACKGCEGVEDEGKTVSIAPMPKEMIPRSISTPSLLTHIFIGKFCDALPFYRQEQQFKRYGLEISRATMCNWAIQVAARLAPLLEMLRLWILSGPLINIDETTVQVLSEPDRKPQSKSYAWVFRGGMVDKPGLIYQYNPSRSGTVAENFIKGFKGYIQTDGFAGYNFLDAKTGITHFGCWAHVRRKFNEVVKAGSDKFKGKGKANQALSMIRDLYLIEREARNKGFDEDQTYQLRQEKSKPILKKFKNFLDTHAIKVPPQSLLGKAFSYALGQWHRLEKYSDTGLVRMDNNLVENAIRPFVVGRKNWLFSVSPKGAESSALFYSLIETAKANDLEPSKYLRYLFEKFPHAQTSEDVFNLLPMNLLSSDLKIDSS